MAKEFKITTPKGTITQKKSKNGQLTAKLEWNNDIGKDLSNKFSEAQKFLDSEILRTTAPYMPNRTGMLIKSGLLGTTIGSGEVNWIAPYAHQQYWNTSDSRAYDEKRGGQWFERSKIDNGAKWISGAKKIAGGKG